MTDEIEIRDLIDSGSRTSQAVFILSREEFEDLKRDYRARRNFRASNPEKLYFQLQSSTKYPDNDVCVISRPAVQDFKQIEAFMTIVIQDDDETIEAKKAELVEKRAIADEIESTMSGKLSENFRDFEEDELETPELLKAAMKKRKKPRSRKSEVVT